jgi:glutathione peroxidase
MVLILNAKCQTNGFLSHEQGTHEEICKFVSSKPTFNGADKKFVFFEKANVNGPDAREVYTFLKDASGGADIAWNFEIFLLDQKGDLVERFKPSRSPYDALKPEIEKLL